VGCCMLYEGYQYYWLLIEQKKAISNGSFGDVFESRRAREDTGLTSVASLSLDCLTVLLKSGEFVHLLTSFEVCPRHEALRSTLRAITRNLRADGCHCWR